MYAPARNFNNFLDESINGGPSIQSVDFVPGDLKNANFTQHHVSPGKLMLPSIQGEKGKQHFKGFLDISIVSQKLRKTMASEGPPTERRKTSVGGATIQDIDGPVEGKMAL